MKRVAVIGGGVAGMQTALRLAEQGVEPVIIEKEAELGGKLRGWHVLFPSFTPASEILTELRRRIAERGIEVMTRTEARGFSREGVQLPDANALKVLEKKLYKNVNISPQNMIRRYSAVRSIIDGSTWISFNIGTAKITQSTVNVTEKTTPESMVVLIWRCRVS